MFRVVIDTNIFGSAVLKPQSSPGLILNLAEDGRLKLILSPDILSEIERVLLYPDLRKMHGLGPREITDYMENLKAFSRVVTPGRRLDVIEADPSDNIFLECAVEGRADFIISGDRHLKDLQTYQGIKIAAPAMFLEMI